ncbi:NAC domain-containing protein 83-like [Prosopis cineraria]|uniref:NAC domain-containing protein 83-like n=1 Tax=Prosopis cineraria TaxID=364024 RepID=UPI00240FBFAA|nr:NAC domain-containing protein 83-like [Prosopis cineraria]
MADPSLKRKRMPVGYRFRPTEQELVAYYLHHRLKIDNPSIYAAIPEIDVCKFEPWDLLAWASATSVTEFDDSECYFFTRCDYKYSKSTRFNRTTSAGFWKVTGKDRNICDRDTNNVIGIKRILVFHEGRFSHKIKSNWVIHEYHNIMLPSNQRTHVLCRLEKKHEKKIKEKNSQMKDTGLRIQISSQTPSQSNKTTDTIQTPSQSNETINITIQTPSQSKEVADKVIQTPSQSNETTIIATQTPFQSNEVTDIAIQTPSQSNEATDILLIQIPSQLIEATDTSIDVSFQFNEDTGMIHTPFQSSEVIAMASFQANEITDPMDQLSPELRSIIETSIDSEGLRSIFGIPINLEESACSFH